MRPAAPSSDRGRVVRASLVVGVLVLVAAACAPPPPAPQTVSFTNAPPAALSGGTYTPVATASSGLPVSFSVDASSTGCSLSGGVVRFDAVGICVVNADQTGDGSFLPAARVQGTTVVSGVFGNGIVDPGEECDDGNASPGDGCNAVGQIERPQVISFASAPSTAVSGLGATYTPTATSTSGLPVSFSVDASSTGCSLTAGVVTFDAVGTCVVNADQAGGSTWLPASRVQGVTTILASTTVIGVSTVPVPWTDSCGVANGRRCESLLGNVLTDAMRRTYGTDFVIWNSGGLRAALTCPPPGSTLCPTSDPAGPFPITAGSVQQVLPFGTRAVTATIDGAVLRSYLENAVAPTNLGRGAFGQVSGLCFAYDIGAAAGARVVGAVRQAADGTCTGAPVDLTAGASYTMVVNDFMASGGDSYPPIAGTVRGIDADVVRVHVAAATPISPTIQGRITCTDPGGVGGCPAPV